jgi:hypothetical protein
LWFLPLNTQLLGAPWSSTLRGVWLWAWEHSWNKSSLAVCSKTVSREWFGVSPLLSQIVGESSRCGSFISTSYWSPICVDLSYWVSSESVPLSFCPSVPLAITSTHIAVLLLSLSNNLLSVTQMILEKGTPDLAVPFLQLLVVSHSSHREARLSTLDSWQT